MFAFITTLIVFYKYYLVVVIYTFRVLYLVFYVIFSLLCAIQNTMRVFIHIFDLCTLTRKFIAHRRFDGSFVFVECDYLFAFFCADIISHDDIHDVEIFLVFERLYE